MYKLVLDQKTQTIACIEVVGKNMFIPLNESNTDYQEYLKWVELGNQPLPADEE